MSASLAATARVTRNHGHVATNTVRAATMAAGVPSAVAAGTGAGDFNLVQVAVGPARTPRANAR